MYRVIHSSKKEHNLSFVKYHFILTVFQKNIYSPCSMNVVALILQRPGRYLLPH